MAISTPIVCAAHATFSGSVPSMASAVSSAVAEGDSVTLCIFIGTSRAVSSVTDTKGNTYTIDSTALISSRRLAVASAHNVTALTTSDTITATFDSNVGAGFIRSFWAANYNGLTGVLVDKSTNATASGTTWSIDPGALTSSEEIVWWSSFGGRSSTAHSPDAGCVEILDGDFGSGPRVTAGYRIASNINDGDVSGNYNFSATWGVALASYRAAIIPGQLSVKSGGVFAQKPLNIKVSGTMAAKPVKVKNGGIFE